MEQPLEVEVKTTLGSPTLDSLLGNSRKLNAADVSEFRTLTQLDLEIAISDFCCWAAGRARTKEEFFFFFSKIAF